MEATKTLPVSGHAAGMSAKIQSEEDFFQEVTRNVRDLVSGERMTPITTVSFASVEALVSVLTPKRTELLEVVRQQGGFNSIESLADKLQRDRAGVSKDLKALNQAGLLNMHEAIHAGHGKRTEISPTAERLRLEVVI